LSEGNGHGGGDSRPRPAADAPALVRHEEEARVETRREEIGRFGARREVSLRTAREQHERRLEDVAEERVPAAPDDSGEVEVLPDGSVSIPLFEEELVVTRRLVLRERVVIRKKLVSQVETVEAELKREHIAFDADDAA
jgi:uncharacterized protein (TIGR02271 family)